MSSPTGLRIVGYVGAAVATYFGQAWAAPLILGATNAAAASREVYRSEGPRLGDLRVQGADYGAELSRLYGTVRISGHVAWNPDMIEIANTETSGGKGGPKYQNTSYSAYANFAVMLCDCRGTGPIAGVSRIWANGKLIYDRSGSASAEAVAASSGLKIRIYTGGAAQMPDPLIESYKGVGNVCAYRGTAYVVFEEFAVGDYGNMVPNLTFEVVASGTAEALRVFPVKKSGLGLEFAASDISWTGSTVFVGYDPADTRPAFSNWLAMIKQEFSLNGTPLRRKTYAIRPPANHNVFTPFLWHHQYVGSIGLYNISVYGSSQWPGGPTAAQLRVFAGAVFASREFVGGIVDSKLVYQNNFDIDSGDNLRWVPGVAIDPQGYLWIGYKSGADWRTKIFDAQLVEVDDFGAERGGDVLADAKNGGTNGGVGGSNRALSFEPGGNFAWLVSGTLVNVYRRNGFSLALVASIAHDLGVNAKGIVAFSGGCMLFSVDSLQVVTRGAVMGSPVDLDDVVQSEALLAGIGPASLDLTALSGQTVLGYQATGTSRQGLEPLESMYLFDFVESGNKIKAVLRGGDPVVTIQEDDLVMTQ
ncbi:hypothetical protein [Chitinolyticbacter meiyuanensis]|uniref:hypothetical protein n=1 Tax=Chitinolyticbacter meiyuanensis TaxID=682798 RepID=UPI0011E5F7DF|nr:hypothetical protein [Chitinolyticbacter meiyuanensis]